MRRAVLAVALIGATAATAASPRKAYERAVDDWTRKLVLHHAFSTTLILRATLLEPPFRDEFATERARLLDPTPDNDATFRRRAAEDAALYYELVLSMSDGIPGEPRFGDGDDAWNLRLLVDDAPAELVTVYEVDDPTPLQLSAFPHHNQWSTLWIARFHRAIPEPRSVVLHVGSGWGHGELTWDLATESDP